MKLAVGIFVVLCSLFVLSEAAVDQTLQYAIIGSDVVKAVEKKITESGIFKSDKGFIRRVAYVLTKFGEDKKTFEKVDSKEYYGGIWRIAEDEYKSLKDNSKLSSVVKKIKDEFGIDWNDSKWSDLLKPLYSGLAARMKMYLSGKTIPRSVKKQAEYYVKYYNTGGNENTFISMVTTLEKQKVCTNARADIIFCLDGSGSIGSTNFQSILKFVKSVVSSLSLGADKVRVGVVQYSDNAQVELNLSNYTDKNALLDEITNIEYLGGGTNTKEGIDLVRKIFKEEPRGKGKATKDKEDLGVLKLGIVLTDGKSNSQSATIQAAENAHKDGITLYSIGIGSNLDETELKAIASSKDKFFELDGFSEMDSFIRQLQEGTCEGVSVLEDMSETKGSVIEFTGTTNKYSPAYYRSKIPSIGATIKIKLKVNKKGHGCKVYISYKIKNPSSAVYDFITSTGFDGVFVPRKKNSNRKRRATATDSDIAYMGVVGDSEDNTDFDMSLKSGNYAPAGSSQPSSGATVKSFLEVVILGVVMAFFARY